MYSFSGFFLAVLSYPLKSLPRRKNRQIPELIATIGLKKSSGHNTVNSSGHLFRVLVDNIWVNSSENFCSVNSNGQC